MPFFSSIDMLLEDPIFGLVKAFENDPRENKVNLGIGAYKDNAGNPFVLSTVRKAEQLILDTRYDKEYLPILGHSQFISGMLQLVFNENSPRISAAQAIGGTGALRIGAEFLLQNGISSHVYISDPSWPNHPQVFSRAGMKVSSYTYYDSNHCTLNFSGMIEAIKNMEPSSVLLLQPCCHNPTGIDPTIEEWEEVFRLIKKNRLIPFFDLAYQGFGQGLTEDAAIVRKFMESGQEMLVACSCAKNFGLYGERAGMLCIISQDKETAEKVTSQLKQIIRSSYSNPPLQSARIVSTILNHPDLHQEWTEELSSMRDRIQNMRHTLISVLQNKSGTGKFQFLAQQSGMFSFSGLNPEQVQQLKERFAIYLPKNGRINIAGLNAQNLDYVAESILAIL